MNIRKLGRDFIRDMAGTLGYNHDSVQTVVVRCEFDDSGVVMSVKVDGAKHDKVIVSTDEACQMLLSAGFHCNAFYAYEITADRDELLHATVSMYGVN